MNQQKQIALGYSDGDIGTDSIDPFTSKLGGQPQWLDETSAIPEQSLAVCGQCNSAMVLLAQTYAPLDKSPYDRVLYIWACNRRICAGKPGAAAAVRGHLLNMDYAKQLVKRNQKSVPKKPASLFGSGQLGSAGGSSKVPDLGSVWQTGADLASGAHEGNSLFTGPLFGKQPEPKVQQETALDIEALSADLGHVSVSDGLPRTEWDSAMESAPAQYLVFEAEELASDKHIREKYRAQIEEALEMAAEGTKGKGSSSRNKQAGSSNEDGMDWSEERYERATLPQGTDAAFAQFTEIVGQNPEQVMRYQFGGMPLLYTRQDEVARMLSSDACTESAHGYDDDDDDDDDSAYWGQYTTAKLAACPHCGGRRVFECQLMPALLSTLSLPVHRDLSAASKPASQLVGAELMRALDLGLEFGTLLVFVCENDCHGGSAGAAHLGNSSDSAKAHSKAAYYQELVLVQLEAN